MKITIDQIKNITAKYWHFVVGIGLGIWLFGFLYLSEPFEIEAFTEAEKQKALPLYGLAATVSYFIGHFLKVRFFKQMFWFYLLIIGIGSVLFYLVYLYALDYGEGMGYPYSYGWYSFYIYLPALLIVLPFVVIARVAGRLFLPIPNFTNNIIVKGEGQTDLLQMPFQQLVFLQSSGNYVEIYFYENESIKRKTLRTTLAKVENQIPNLLRTHRSFLINPQYFQGFENQNNKLTIQLQSGHEIPVSRKLQSQIKSTLPSATK